MCTLQKTSQINDDKTPVSHEIQVSAMEFSSHVCRIRRNMKHGEYQLITVSTTQHNETRTTILLKITCRSFSTPFAVPPTIVCLLNETAMCILNNTPAASETSEIIPKLRISPQLVDLCITGKPCFSYTHVSTRILVIIIAIFALLSFVRYF